MKNESDIDDEFKDRYERHDPNAHKPRYFGSGSDGDRFDRLTPDEDWERGIYKDRQTFKILRILAIGVFGIWLPFQIYCQLLGPYLLNSEIANAPLVQVNELTNWASQKNSANANC